MMNPADIYTCLQDSSYSISPFGLRSFRRYILRSIGRNVDSIGWNVSSVRWNICSNLWNGERVGQKWHITPHISGQDMAEFMHCKRSFNLSDGYWKSLTHKKVKSSVFWHKDIAFLVFHILIVLIWMIRHIRYGNCHSKGKDTEHCVPTAVKSLC